MAERDLVFFINTPDMKAISPRDLFSESGDNKRKRKGKAFFPHLGMLSLASYLEKNSSLKAGYIDCGACPPANMLALIRENRDKLFAVCISALTSNYGTGVELSRFVIEQTGGKALTIMGNDYFSVFADEIMKKNETIKFGFKGNEVFDPLNRFLQDRYLSKGQDFSSYPGLVYRNGQEIVHVPAAREAVPDHIDYDLLDRNYPHSKIYQENFRGPFSKLMSQHLGRTIDRLTSVEFARGCIKFKNNNACSFCSIQYGDMWRNQVASADRAWGLIEKAQAAGHQAIIITADELPLTFPHLLTEMARNRPKWHRNMKANERPVLIGYARADGLQNETIVKAMKEIGFRVCYVGVDAGAPLSLAVMNKTLTNGNIELQAKRLFTANQMAAANAAKHGILLELGIVLGHIGMTPKLLDENVRNICRLFDTNTKAITSVEISSLLPMPGSRDYELLINPVKAEDMARKYGLKIGDDKTRQDIAEKFKGSLFDNEKRMPEAQDAFHQALMPAVPPGLLNKAAHRIWNHARHKNILALCRTG